MSRRLSALMVVLMTAALLCGCSFQGLNSIVLPGSTGTGDDGYDLEVELDNVVNLLPNSEVKLNDVTVGTVRTIEVDGWHARVGISVANEVQLPSDVRASVAQKSLLGAEYLELRVPAGSTAPKLADGDKISLAQTGRYPETEEVLAALSQVLNGGGLANIEVIVRELNVALDGNVQPARALINDLGSLMATLGRQRGGITRSLDALDRFSGRLAKDIDTVGVALDQLGPGIKVLANQRVQLTGAAKALDRLAIVGNRVIARSGPALRADLADLRTITASLERAGSGLTGSLDLVGTILFPVSAVNRVVKGDYLSVAVTLDVSLPMLERGLLPSGGGQNVVTLLQSLLLAGVSTTDVPLPGEPVPDTDKPGVDPVPDPDDSDDLPIPDLPPAPTGPLGGLLGLLLGGNG